MPRIPLDAIVDILCDSISSDFDAVQRLYTPLATREILLARKLCHRLAYGDHLSLLLRRIALIIPDNERFCKMPVFWKLNARLVHDIRIYNVKDKGLLEFLESLNVRSRVGSGVDLVVGHFVGSGRTHKLELLGCNIDGDPLLTVVSGIHTLVVNCYNITDLSGLQGVHTLKFVFRGSTFRMKPIPKSIHVLKLNSYHVHLISDDAPYPERDNYLIECLENVRELDIKFKHTIFDPSVLSRGRIKTLTLTGCNALRCSSDTLESLDFDLRLRNCWDSIFDSLKSIPNVVIKNCEQSYSNGKVNASWGVVPVRFRYHDLSILCLGYWKAKMI